MHLIQYNFTWMSLNILLAVLPVVLGWVFIYSKNKIFRIIIGFLWLFFLPNALYLFTDLLNLIKQWPRVDSAAKLVFIFQYGILTSVGFITSILALYPFEKHLGTLGWIKRKGGVDRYIIIMNFIIGFGITLGRTERVNSWEIVTNPINIVYSTLNILFTPELVALTVLFGLFANFYYFLFRKVIIRYTNIYLSQAGF